MAEPDLPGSPSSSEPPKKPSRLATLWQKLGLDTITLVLMAKYEEIPPRPRIGKTADFLI